MHTAVSLSVADIKKLYETGMPQLIAAIKAASNSGRSIVMLDDAGADDTVPGTVKLQTVIYSAICAKEGKSNPETELDVDYDDKETKDAAKQIFQAALHWIDQEVK